MPPIVSVVGKSKSGKTTLIKKLVQELILMSRVRIAGPTFKQA
jgi:molybdopterin-guanine dinucleotide biosynthesis protein